MQRLYGRSGMRIESRERMGLPIERRLFRNTHEGGKISHGFNVQDTRFKAG